jgi:hypothetical protein
MKRRQFIAERGSAVAWPMVAPAQSQQTALPVIGHLVAATPSGRAGEVIE